ncbi:MAG: oligosaccharide flippase family protein [candidate division Zixibacteria bacterium]|nr:oligosaccharide flippase family protein [candidate division Zixibacteria bacterium]NIR68263.1 oligosaccharide flippase family protein [candidate division Zixibacteria bacterium]NIS18185.1 oligosaccharide flippase family protein [candidate division Zixibacteria bacterium]NIS49429.1 oligosaccharide flippase family protein [candidate division Zixibacteria bacterium]NIT54453.1 oligosaccharide flippase family protein [candidate division Zixibacteria bacterium]
MWNEIKTILRHSSVYGLAILLTNAMSIVLLPLYMNYLNPNEIGLLEIINRTNDILRIILMVGMVTTTLRFYQEKDSEIYRKKVISTAMQFLAVFSFLVVGMLIIFANQLADIIFASTKYVIYVRLMLLMIFFEVLYIVPILYFQARLQSTVFVLISVSRFLIGLALIVYLVAYRDMGIAGVLWGHIIHVGIFGIALFGYILIRVGVRFDLSLLREMIKFGLPFVPGSIFLFILNSGDRYILLHLTSSDSVGIYAIGYRIGTLTTALVMSPFLRVWSALYVKYAQRQDRDCLFANFMTYVVFTYTFVSMAIILFRRELLAIFGEVIYWKAAAVVPWIALAYLFWAASLVLDSGFYIAKKTMYKPFLFGISAAVAVILCLILIPRIDYHGAAFATVVSFAAYFLISLVAVQRLFPINYQWKRMITITIAGLAIVAADELLIGSRPIISLISLDWGEWFLWMTIKTTLLFLFPVILYVINFYRPEEKRKIRQLCGMKSS